MGEQVDKWICVDRLKDRWMDVVMFREMDRWMDGRTDGEDRQTGTCK